MRPGPILIMMLILILNGCSVKNVNVDLSKKVNPVDGAEIILIPPGEFPMGSPENEGNPDEHPIHRVYLSEYYIYKTEVTNLQYKNFIKKTGYKPGGTWVMENGKDWEKLPASGLTWYDASAYAKWAGADLPTEAQWEKAARGETWRRYPWGNRWEENRCNWDDTGGVDQFTGKPAPVGFYPDGASPYGVLDMAGNLWEWCLDWYSPDYYKTSEYREPAGPTEGSQKVKKGGSWGHDAHSEPLSWRISLRSPAFPQSSSPDTGFRCVIKSTNLPE